MDNVRSKMKIIHTSDWHIGQIFNEYDRSEEHLAFFSELADIISAEKPDALLVSGDVFDSAMPSAQSQRLYTDALLRLKNACPDMTIVVSAGNHDSGSRLESVRNLWDRNGVKVVGCLSRNDGQVRYADHIFRINSSSDPEKPAGYVIALPHIYRQNYPACQEGDRQQSFYRKLADAVSDENTGRLPVVMMAHLAVSGSDLSGHDTMAGGMDFVPAGIFPEACDYVALGHIHKAQTLHVGRKENENTDGRSSHGPVIRYSGSPIPLSFDENYTHSVSIVDIPESGTVTVREQEIPCSIPVITVPAKPVPFRDALSVLESFPADEKAYIRLNVLISDFLPQNASVQAVMAAEGKKCRYCSMKITRTGESGVKGTDSLTVDEMKSMDPVEVAGMYYRRRFGNEMDEDMEKMLVEAIGKVEEERREQ